MRAGQTPDYLNKLQLAERLGFTRRVVEDTTHFNFGCLYGLIRNSSVIATTVATVANFFKLKCGFFWAFMGLIEQSSHERQNTILHSGRRRGTRTCLIF